MKIRLIIFALLLVNMVSCNLGSNKFDMIKAKGLEGDNLRLNTTMFYNNDTGFIAGSSDIVTPNPDFPEKDSNQFAFLKEKSLLFKTTDGGRSWTRKDFGEGRFRNIIRVGSKLFAIKISQENSHSFIYSSTDMGQNWIEEMSFSNVVTDIFIIESQILLIAKNEKGIFQFYISEGMEKPWSIVKSPLPIYDAILKEQRLFYLSSNISNDYRKNLLVEYDMVDSIKKVIELPKEFNCYFLTNHNGEVKLTGLKEGYISVYSLQENNQIKYEYSYTKEDGFFPQGYYNNKGEEWIIVGKRGDADVSNKILKTSDNGNHWEVINFKKEKHIQPFCFYNNNGQVKAWFYSGFEKFQILK